MNYHDDQNRIQAVKIGSYETLEGLEKFNNIRGKWLLDNCPFSDEPKRMHLFVQDVNTGIILHNRTWDRVCSC